MKTHIYNSIGKGFILFTIVLFSFSCTKDYYGYDGEPGKAFLALTWYDLEPEYLDVGNTDIPYTFYWDEYYRTSPGMYTLYYELSVYNGRIIEWHAYEVEYEIWINLGEPGGRNYNGRDGANTYFTIELCPEGPYFIEESHLKSKDIENEPKREMMKLGEEKKITMEKNNFGMNVAYKKVEPRSLAN